MGCQWPQLGLGSLGDIRPSSQSCEVLQTPPSIPGTPVHMPMDHTHLCMLLGHGFPGQGQGLNPAHRSGGISPHEGPGIHVLDGQGQESLQTTALTK